MTRSMAQGEVALPPGSSQLVLWALYCTWFGAAAFVPWLWGEIPEALVGTVALVCAGGLLIRESVHRHLVPAMLCAYLLIHGVGLFRPTIWVLPGVFLAGGLVAVLAAIGFASGAGQRLSWKLTAWFFAVETLWFLANLLPSLSGISQVTYMPAGLLALWIALLNFQGK